MEEQNKDKLHIRLHVYNENIDAVINRSEEEDYRAAARLVTERYGAYAQAYGGQKSDHTIALMTLVEIALMYRQEQQRKDATPYDNVLNRLTTELDGLLKG